MTYMEAMTKIEELAMAQESPFTFCDFYQKAQDIIDSCEASKEDVVTRAFTRMHEHGQLLTVRTGEGKTEYISSAKYTESEDEKT